MDSEFGLDADEISSILLRSHMSVIHKDAYRSLFQFFLIGSPCLSAWLLDPDGSRKIESGRFRNALYDKRSGLVFMNVSIGHSLILPCWLEALYCTDFSKPYPGGWHPSKIGPWNYIEVFSGNYIGRGHGLFLPDTRGNSIRTLRHSKGFSWTTPELRAFGRYASSVSTTLSK